jgi:hypothetical protein
MRNLWRTLTIGASALAVAVTVSAAQAAKPASAKTAPAKTTAAKSTAKSATGKITKYDAGSRTLTITTAKGSENFVLADSASVHEGSKAITADDLSSHTGQTAKIRYADANGTMRAEMVTVASSKPAAKSSKKTGK